MADCLRKHKLQNNIFKNLQLNYLKTRNELFNKLPKKQKIDNVSLNNIVVKLKQAMYNTKEFNLLKENILPCLNQHKIIHKPKRVF